MVKQSQVGLKFLLFDVFKILFERGTSDRMYEYNLKIDNALRLDENDPASFQIYFHITIGSNQEEKPLNIQVEAIGHFELVGAAGIHNDILDNYKNISAPSIVYPYIRAFLSTLTLQAGMNPINLPPLNFGMQQIVDGEQVDIGHIEQAND
jgi:preprotein translocase subunit SecB